VFIAIFDYLNQISVNALVIAEHNNKKVFVDKRFLGQTKLTLCEEQRSVEVRTRVRLVLDMKLLQCQSRLSTRLHET